MTYVIEPSVYEHTNISDRPEILIDDYAKKKRYLTVIFMWDQLQGEIPAWKFNPVNLVLGETGCRDDADETRTVSSMDKSKATFKSKSAASKEDTMASMVTLSKVYLVHK